MEAHTQQHDDAVDTDPTDTEPVEESPRGSLLDRLRERRKEMAEEEASGERTLELPIPGYKGDLYARFTYKPDAWDKLKQIGQKAIKSKHPRRELYVAMDTLAMACTDLLVSEDEGLTFESLDPTGEPTPFGEKAAELLEIPNAYKTRAVIAGIFNNNLAITAMSNRVSEWMQGEDEDYDEDF